MARLTCDMDRACTRPVTYIDRKGYLYCTAHGQQRRAGGIACRRIKPYEWPQLERGEPITWQPRAGTP